DTCGRCCTLMPPLADAAVFANPGNMDEISFLPTLLDKPALQRRHPFLYWEFDEKKAKQAVRLENWKFVRLTDGRTELYDLQSDPAELHDVAAQNPVVIQSIDILLQSPQ